jgi:hypothetical protein
MLHSKKFVELDMYIDNLFLFVLNVKSIKMSLMIYEIIFNHI